MTFESFEKTNLHLFILEKQRPKQHLEHNRKTIPSTKTRLILGLVITR